MIIRIVRMTFEDQYVDRFLEIFDMSKEKIRSFPGCRHLELLVDVQHPNIFSTYSMWENESDLNKYRDSELFGQVWPDTKKLFAAPAVANSYYQKIKLG
ncbi:antibiotic biosynthesis monooxygenase [Reichenbachiella carrageenanivorans]|uniref:Antibiotic biosynthesis monooxygenase n=1 Tax=Reichenbachiella carrageenanivorans TaxID=2979869 RepID=A0ABY6CV88_9BACT|nr:antibiotic biosynthesis monooxygenase family protein [Reichenbachiella carrageenanivorans]UXX77819.1 antibiotic biosynthesis monooxygenase [Reichenbachiella carrageenanivorans]